MKFNYFVLFLYPDGIYKCMDIHERDALWSKYYLTNDMDCFSTLSNFVKNEATTNNKISKRYQSSKAKKTMREMLKALPKKEIIRKYNMASKQSSSKRIIINSIIRYI